VSPNSSKVLNSETDSHYKSTTTLKCLVGISTFFKQSLAGCISDKEITESSGILDLLPEGDGVMVDKGFHATLVIPPLAQVGSSTIRNLDVYNLVGQSR